MFEKQDIERLEQLGYKVFQGDTILTSDGQYVPSVTVGNKTYSSIYGDDVNAFQADYDTSQQAKKDGFKYDDSKPTDEYLQVQDFAAKKQVERYEKNPDEVALDLSNGHIRNALENKNQETGLLYHTSPEDYVQDKNATSDDPVIKELSGASPAVVNDLKSVRNRIKEIQEKDSDIDTKIKKNDDTEEALAENSWYNPENISIYLEKAMVGAVKMFSPTGAGMSDPKLKKEYIDLKKKEKAIEDIAVGSRLEKEKAMLEQISAEHKSLSDKFGTGDFQEGDVERIDRLGDRKFALQRRVKELEDRLSYDSNNMFSNIANAFVNQGIKSLDSMLAKDATSGYFKVLPAAERIKEGTASKEDEQIVSDYIDQQGFQDFTSRLESPGEAYNITTGLTGSLGFIGEISLSPTKGASGTIKKAANKMVSNRARGLVTNAIKTSAAKLGKVLPAKIGTLANKATDFTGRVLKEGVDAAFTPLGMGSTYSKLFNNQHPIIFDDQGNLLLDEDAYKFETTKLTAQYNKSQEIINQLAEKPNITNEEKETLKQAMSFVGTEGTIHGVNRNKAVETYSNMVDKMQEMKGMGAFYNAYVDNVAETFSERLGALGVGKELERLAKGNKYTRRLVDNRLVDNFNKYSKAVNRFSGGHVHGVFDEILEENAVPYIKYGLSGNDKHEIYQMRNWNAQKDVAIQTVAMNLLFRAPSAIQQNLTKEGRAQKKYLKDIRRQNRTEKDRLTKLYKDIATVGSSQDLGKIVDLTAIPGQPNEHTLNQVTNLKAEGKDKEAKELQDSMFHYNAIAAVATGTENDFKWAMRKLTKDPNLADAQESIDTALNSLEKYKKYKETYDNKAGSDIIVQNLFNRDLTEREIEKAEEDLQERVIANQFEVNLFEKSFENKAEKFEDKDYTEGAGASRYLTRQYNDPQVQAEFEKELMNHAKSFSPEVQGVVNSGAQKVGTLKESLNTINNLHIELNSPQVQRKIAAKQAVQAELYKMYLANQGKVTPQEATQVVNDTYENNPDLDAKTKQEVQEETQAEVQDINTQAEIQKNTTEQQNIKNELEQPVENKPALPVEGSEVNEAAEDIMNDDILSVDQDGGNKLSPEDLAALSLSRRKITKPVTKAYADKVDNYIKNKIEPELDRDATFQDLIEDMIKSSSYNKVDDAFDVLAKAWQKTGRPLENPDSVYNKYFVSAESIIDEGISDFTSDTQDEVQEVNTQQQDEVNKLTTKRKKFNPNTNTPQVEDVVVEDGKTLSPDYKFAYNFQQLKMIDGEYVILSRDLKSVDPNDILDNKFILDSDFTAELQRNGTPLTVRAMDLDELPVGGGKTWGQIKEENRSNPNYQTWYRNTVPMTVIYDNPNTNQPVVLAMVHTDNWYNKENISLRKGEAEQTRVIEKGRQTIQDLRKQVIANGSAQVQIDNISTGPFHKTNKQIDKTPLSISEATGDSTLAVVLEEGGRLFPAINGSKKAFDKGVLSSDLNMGSFNKGEVVDIRQVGTSKEGSPIYTAFKVMVNSPSVENPVLKHNLPEWVSDNLKYATLTSVVLNNKENTDLLQQINTKYNFNVTKADMLNRAVGNESGIYPASNLAEYFKLFVQVGSRDTFQDRVNRGDKGLTYFDNNVPNEIKLTHKSKDFYSGHMSIGAKSTDTNKTMQNIERAFGQNGITGKTRFNVDFGYLGKSDRFKISQIKDGEIVPGSAKSFDEVQKDNLRTDVISHQIQDINGEDKWITAVQPKINFSLQEQAVVEQPTSIQDRIEQAVEETNLEDSADTPLKKAMVGMNATERELFEQMIASGQITLDSGIQPNFSRRKLNETELTNVQNISTTKIDGITNQQQKSIEDSLVNSIVSGFDFTKTITNTDIKNAIEGAVDTYLTPLLNTQRGIYNNVKTIPALSVSAQDFADRIAVLENIINQKNKLVSTTPNNIGSLTNKFNTLLGQNFEEEDDVIGDTDSFSKSFLEKDISLSYSNQLKLSFYGYEKTNKNGNKLVNFVGTPEFHSADDIVLKLKEVTSTIPSNWDKLINRLEDAAETRKDNLYVRIKDKIDSYPEHIKNELLYKNISKKLTVFKVINSPKYTYVKDESGKSTRIVESYNLQVYDENSSKEDIRWKQEIKSNYPSVGFGILNDNKELTLNRLYAGNIQKKLFEAATKNDTRFETVRELFDLIGLEAFPDNTVKEYLEAEKNNIYNANGLLGRFNTELSKVIQKQDPVMLEESSNVPFNNMNTILNKLIELETTLNGSFVANSIRVSGKTMQGVIANTSFYDTTQELSDASSNLLDTYLNQSYTKNNFVLKYLKEDAKFRENFQNIGFSSPDSYKLHGKNNAGETSMDKISEQDNLATTLAIYSNTRGNLELTNKKGEIPGVDGLTFRNGKMLSNTLSDKGRLLYMNTLLLNLNRDNVNFSETGEASFDGFLGDFLVDQMFMPEFERILDSYKDNTNVKGYDSAAKIFLAMPSFNAITVNGKNIHRYLSATKTGYTIPGNIIEQIKREAKVKLEDYITNETKSKIDIEGKTGMFYELGFYKRPRFKGESPIHNIDSNYIKSKNIGDPEVALRLFAAEFAVNNMLNQNNIYQVYLGDMAFYAKDKAIPMVNKTYTDETGKQVTARVVDYEKVSQPEVYGSILEGIGVIVDKRAASLIAPGLKMANANNPLSEAPQSFIHLAMEDVIGVTNTMVELIESRYEGEFTQEMRDALNQIKALKTQLDLNPELKKDVHKEIRGLASRYFGDISDYFNIEGTDAQEYTTWKAHIDMLFRQGKLTREQEATLSGAYNKLIRGEDVSKEELDVIMQPVKPVYTGLVPFKNVMRPIYIKSSAFPLLPQVTRNLKIDSLRDKMEDLETRRSLPVRVSYQTANKIGALKSDLTMDSVYENSLDNLGPEIDSALSVLPMKNFKIQQETPSKENKYYKKNKDAQITMGSQFFKIILGNGINHMDERVFKNIFSPAFLEEQGIDSSKKMLSGKELDKIYTQAYFDYSDTLQDDLHKELGIKSTEGFYNLPLAKRNKVIQNLHKILKSEVDTRSYPEFLKDSLQLTTNDDGSIGTIMPLMFDSNSHKFESLLQALISNRLIVHTLPGNGHIAASSEGFDRKDTYDSLTANEKRGIIWIDPNREGDLKSTFNKDGEVTESEVLIQTHYKIFNEDGTVKYVDLSSDMYSENIMDGDMVVGRKLRLDMIDEQLLTNFTFRIPTSSHQSGVIVKVAGFLPKEMGDILIVPKEHTTQLGEDYDIDKRFVYKSNYQVAPDGRVKKLNYENIKDKLELINSLKDKSNTEINNVMSAMFKEFNSEELIQELQEELNLLGIDATAEDRVTASQRTLSKLKVKMLENTIIDIYKSVYTSPSNDIQKKIFKPLVTDVAEDTSGLMQSKLVAAKDLTNFSILSDNYQRYLLNLGSDGKGGIGVHSNAVTLEAQLQRLPMDEKLQLRTTVYKKVDGETVKDIVPFKDRLGGFEFKGKLGDRTKTFDGYREVAEQHGENQNVSTDNINKQIMGKRNENNHTMSVYALLAHMGYDLSKNAVTNEFGKPMQMHLPSLLMNQPVIREFVRLKNMLSGVTQDFNPNVDKEIIEMLSSQFQFPIKKGSSGVNTLDFIPNGYSVESLENMLSGQTLWDNLKDEEASADIQMIVLQKFFRYRKYADQLAEVQGLINLSTSKLGVSYFETNQRVEVLNKVAEGSEDVPVNAGRLIGDSFPVATDNQGTEISYERYLEGVVDPTEQENVKELIEKVNSGEYSKIGRFYWKPTTIEGKMLVNSISSANSILPIFYPYNNPVVKGMIDDIFINKGADSAKKSGANLKWKYEIMSEFNNFISSNNDLFTGNVNEERERLFFETEDSKPLAWILKDLASKKNPVMDNSLLKDLRFEVGVEGQMSLITHFNTQGNSIDADAKYNAFVELVQSDEILGEYNGEVLTVSKLAQDLATYAYLADNQNGATGFRNYVSVPYLDAIGTTGRYRKIFDAFINHGRLIAKRFEKQYFQHHPERAFVVDETSVKEVQEGVLGLANNKMPTDANGKNIVPRYISIRDASKKEGKKWGLYQNTTHNNYKAIDVLGDAKYNEYDSREASEQKTSLGKAKVKVGGDVVQIGKVIKVKLPNNTMLDYDKLNPVLKNKSLKELVTFFNDSTLIPNPKKEFISEVLEYVDPSTKVSFGIPSRGALGQYDKSTNTIMLHENLLTKSIGLANNDFVKGFEIAREVALEEAIHAVTVTAFDKYVADVSENKEVELTNDAPLFAKKLVALFESARTNVPFEPNDMSTYYSKNIYEFMAGMFVSQDYRDRLGEKKSSLINDFKRILKDLFKFLYKERTGETVKYDNEVFKAIQEMLKVSDKPTQGPEQGTFNSRMNAMADVKINDPVTRPLEQKDVSLQEEIEDPLNCK